jgi:hypothetical protein
MLPHPPPPLHPIALTAQVLYRNLSGEQGQPFYSVNGGKAMLLQAYPDALPEAVTEYIRSQKLVIAHDAATHGFVLPGYPTTPELQALVKQQTELRQQQVCGVACGEHASCFHANLSYGLHPKLHPLHIVSCVTILLLRCIWVSRSVGPP